MGGFQADSVVTGGSPPATPIVMKRPPQPRIFPDLAPTFGLPLPPSPAPPPSPPPAPPAPYSVLPPVVHRIKNGHGWVSPPDPDCLSLGHRTGPWHVAEDSKPGILVGKSWRCPKCTELYQPIYNLVANTSAPKCKDCKIENISSYSWTLTRVILNHIRLDFPSLYQQKVDMCAPYSFIALCDLLRTIRGAKHGWSEPANLSVPRILVIYGEVHGFAFGKEPDSYQRCFGRIENLLTSMCLKGVPYVPTKFEMLHPKVPRGSLKIKCWFRISVQEVEKITRLLANGIPMIGIIPPGILFEYVKAKQTYHAPRASKVPTLHAVVLHGSGYEAPRGTFYSGRNSWGPTSHGYYELKDTGADFQIWSRDLVGFVYGCELGD